MNLKSFHSGCRNWKTQVGILGLLALWSAAAASGLPDNPKDPPLPPTSMGEVYGDSRYSTLPRTYVLRGECDDSTTTEQERKNAIRLQDGNTPNEGRVEICIDFPHDSSGPIWSKVCHDRWSVKDAVAVCRQLGYTPGNGGRVRAQSFRNSHFGAGTAPYSLNNFLCSGNEEALVGCITAGGRNIGIDAKHCNDKHAAGVRCLDIITGDAVLQNLYVQETATGDPITIKPGPKNNPHTGFVSDQFHYYTVPEVPPAISEITIYATKRDGGAVVEYYDSSSNLLGGGSSLPVKNLAMGWTQIYVRVKADDGTIEVYEVNIDRR